MRVVVKMKPEIGSALQQGVHDDATRPFESLIEELGVTLEPQHPGIDDPELASYFLVEVPDAGDSDRVIERLRENDAIEGAYVTPPEEPAGL